MRSVKSVKDSLGILAFKFDCIAADGDAIIDGAASAASAQVLTAKDFVSADPIGKPGAFVTFAFSSHANWDATTAIFTGEDAAGRIVSEEISIPDGGNVTRTSTKRYVRPISLEIPAQSGTSGTVDVGWANRVEGDDIPIPVVVTIDSFRQEILLDLKVPKDQIQAMFVQVHETNYDPSQIAGMATAQWSVTGTTATIEGIFLPEGTDAAHEALDFNGYTVEVMVLFKA